jgi:hypothetical protein
MIEDLRVDYDFLKKLYDIDGKDEFGGVHEFN